MEKFNAVGIDPSLISTALAVDNGKKLHLVNWCREKDATNKKGLSKWYAMADGHVMYEYINYSKWTEYSDGEVAKIKDYDIITSNIVDTISTLIDPDLPIRIAIEGYSYSSAVGDLIDLVTYSTLLRKKLIDRFGDVLTIVAPSSLKLASCQMAYAPVEKITGKRVQKVTYGHRNTLGIAGGSFTKTDMLMAIIEGSFEDSWAELIRKSKDDFLSVSKVNKPFEDVNDAYLLCRSLSHNCV